MEINGVGFKDPAADGSTNAASSTLAGTFDTFLALLTTQLQNQDPLDPMKSEQFTQQLVQFAGVEQSINTNKKLEQLIELQTAGQLNSAVSYMGKTVEVTFDKQGRFAIRCAIHPLMRLMIKVQ
jgi:flagellar basal-body rod modification protein FlgD